MNLETTILKTEQAYLNYIKNHNHAYIGFVTEKYNEVMKAARNNPNNLSENTLMDMLNSIIKSLT